MYNSSQSRNFGVLADASATDPDARRLLERAAKEESIKRARSGRRLYEQGRACAFDESGKYFNQAISEFTAAIRQCQCFSYYSSRAQCYLELAEYESALKDCDKALFLVKPEKNIDIVKSLLRKGKALHGMQRYVDAVHVIEAADALMPNQPEILEELELLRHLASLENDKPNNERQHSPLGIDLNYSAAAAKPLGNSTKPIVPKKDPLYDPANPLHAVTIWVGNFQGKKATDSAFLNMFRKYGPIKSYIVVSKKNFGIVTLTDWKKAAVAMEDLQDEVFDGVMLKLRFKVDGDVEKRSKPGMTNNEISASSLHDSGSISPHELPSISSTPALQRSPKENNAIWVGFGKLPDDICEKDIYDLFISCGSIKSYRLLANKSACAFVNFVRAESVIAAVNTYNGYVYKGKKMRVERKVEPTDSDTYHDELSVGYANSDIEDNEEEKEQRAIWVGSLYDPAITKQHLEDLFRPFNPTSIYMLTERSHCAFVNFRNAADAFRAYMVCNGAAVGPNNQKIVVQMKSMQK